VLCEVLAGACGGLSSSNRCLAVCPCKWYALPPQVGMVCCWLSRSSRRQATGVKQQVSSNRCQGLSACLCKWRAPKGASGMLQLVASPTAAAAAATPCAGILPDFMERGVHARPAGVYAHAAAARRDARPAVQARHRDQDVRDLVRDHPQAQHQPRWDL